MFDATRRSNFAEKFISNELFFPDSAVELSYEEMDYIDGGASLYIPNHVLVGILGWAAGLSVPMLVTYATVIKTTLSALVGGMSLGVGIGIAAFIIGTDSLSLAVELFSAFSNGWGLEVSLNNKKFFGVSIPIGLNWEAK